MSHRLTIFAIVSLLMVASAACGSGTDADDTPAGTPDSACLVGDPDCYETGAEPGTDGPDHAFAVDAALQTAYGLLGLPEGQLPDDVRIARRGLEHMALTEDYVLGRLTVDLDDTDGSGYRVVDVTVELPDGPETVELTPG